MTIDKAHLTVIADDPSKTYDGSTFTAFTVHYTGLVNGDPPSVVSGAASFGGSAVGAIGAGTYTITPGSGSLAATNYDFTTFVSGTLTINKAHLTVTADAQSKTYDGSPFTAFTVHYTGLVNGDSLSVVGGAASFGGPAISAAGAGTYTITPGPGSLTAANYDFTTFVNGALTINKAHLTVIADNQSKTYDGSTFSEFTAHYTGFVNGDTTGVVSGGPSFGGAAVTAIGAGTYTITPGPGSLTAANYDFTTFVNGTLSIAKAPLTVIADDQSKTYDSSPFTAYTAHYTGFVNGDPPSVVSGAASFGGAAVGAAGAGTYTITPGPGSLTAANYDFTTFVNGTLTISKAHLTVSADDQSKTYDGTPFTAFTVHYVGLVNGDPPSVVSGAASFGGSAVGAVNAGTYTITPGPGSLTAANYDLTTFVNGTLTISKAPLTVTADDQSKTYDGSPFSAFTAHYTGFVNGDTPGVVSGGPSFGGPAVTAVGAGTYAITPELGSLAAANYDFTSFVNGTLTINNAHLTVIADDQSKTYDGSPFTAYTAHYTGFVNGDPPSVVSGAASFGGSAVSDVGAGTYTITPGPGSLTAANYDFTTFVNGILTISKAHLSVVADDQSKTYDGSPFSAFTAHYTGFVNSDSPGVVSGAASFGGSAVGAAGAGTYAITAGPGSLSAANYDFTTFVNGTLTINKAHLTVVADDQSKADDGSPFTAFTLHYVGLVNGDPQSVVSGEASIGGSAVGAVNPALHDRPRAGQPQRGQLRLHQLCRRHADHHAPGETGRPAAAGDDDRRPAGVRQ